MITPRNIVLIMASLSAVILLSNAQYCFAQNDKILKSAQIRDLIHDRLFEQGPFVASWQIEREEQPDFESFARGREMEVTQTIGLSAHLQGFIEKNSFAAASGKNWPSLHFLTPGQILSVIENPDGDTYVLEPDREQLFFAARGIPPAVGAALP